MGEEIVAPMRSAMPQRNQWDTFKRRVLPLLGLAPTEHPGSRDHAGGGLNALRAVRFSPKHRTFLSGHYFFQKVLCTEDFLGLFRAFLNVVSGRVVQTSSLHILYPDIVTIGVDTGYTRQSFELSMMDLEQHTHSLTLELSSGTRYSMSGDAGSEGRIESSGDEGLQRVLSDANRAFRDQIVNLRALIRDAKSKRGAATA